MEYDTVTFIDHHHSKLIFTVILSKQDKKVAPKKRCYICDRGKINTNLSDAPYPHM